MESINIMLVEDEEITAEITRRNLERWGYVVSAVVPSGEKAIKHAEAVTPDLVLMDIGLQGDIDGIQAAQRIRECFHIPVIYLTASDDAETLARAKLTGPFGYIIKPIEETQLRATIDLALYKHEVEKKLQFQNAVLAAQNEASPDGILVEDENGKWVSFNQRFIEMWNIPPEVAALKSSEHALAWVLDMLVNSDQVVSQVEYLYEHLNEPSHEEIELVDGRTFERYSAPMFGRGHRYCGRVWYYRDITERKQHEQELLEARTLSSLSRTTASIAHEMRTPLTATEMDLEYIADELPDGELKDLVLDAQESIRETLLIIRTMMKVYRGENQAIAQTDLNQELSDAVLLLGEKTKGVDIKYDFTDDAKTRLRGNVSRIFVNLIGNALDALQNQGRLILTNRLIKEHFVVTVEDNGSGIPPEIVGKIFEPEFTTKKSGEGTGLGLWIVKQAVDRIGGRISVESEPGKFTRLIVAIPHHNEEGINNE